MDYTEFFKVPFEDALELVKSRKCYITQGTAYVPRDEMLSITVGIFRSRFSASLTMTSKALPDLEEDDRLMPMLEALSKQNTGTDFAKRGDSDAQVCLADLPKLSEESFAPCMRDLHENLTSLHHLKHFGRLQYGLFLKGIGLSLEDAMLFWRSELTKKISADKFDKEYAYNIRFNYGKEGKRANYTPYSCVKIILGNAPGGGDHHGCPFKHFDALSLRDRLRTWKIAQPAITEILQLCQDQKFQIACTRYFEVTHKTNPNELMGITHPNGYFEASRMILTGKKANTSFVVPPSQSSTAPSTQVDGTQLEGVRGTRVNSSFYLFLFFSSFLFFKHLFPWDPNICL